MCNQGTKEAVVREAGTGDYEQWTAATLNLRELSSWILGLITGSSAKVWSFSTWRDHHFVIYDSLNILVGRTGVSSPDSHQSHLTSATYHCSSDMGTHWVIQHFTQCRQRWFVCWIHGPQDIHLPD